MDKSRISNWVNPFLHPPMSICSCLLSRWENLLSTLLALLLSSHQVQQHNGKVQGPEKWLGGYHNNLSKPQISYDKKQDCQSSRQISEDRGKISFILLYCVEWDRNFHWFLCRRHCWGFTSYAAVYGAAKSWTRLNNNISLFTLYILEMKQKHEMNL